MSGETSVTLNQNTTAGATVACFQDAATSRYHQEVIVQTQAASSDPVSVSTSNPLPVGGSVADGSTDSGSGVKVAGIYQTSAPTLSNGQRQSFLVDSSGNLKVNIAAGGAAGGTSSSIGSAVPGTGTLAGVANNAGTQMTYMSVDGSGNLKVNIAAGGVPSGQDNSNFTSGSTQGLTILGVYNDAISNLTTGNEGTPRLTADRKWHVAVGAASSGGWTVQTLVSANSNNLTAVKASAGQIGWINAVNNSASTWHYLKVFNVPSGSVTMGTTTATLNLGIPPGGGLVIPNTALALGGSGIAIAVTAGISLTDNTSATANAIAVNLGYQ